MQSNKEKLMEAFSDTEYQKRLITARNEIEQLLDAFLEWLAEELRPEQKFIRNLEMRVKSLSSFLEKIERNDYINTWVLSDKKAEIQEVISQNLPDLIGFRINCYFFEDEKDIYENLKKYEAAGKLENIVLDFSENTKQKNGHILYKVTGKYKKEVNFEIQVKSLIHNFWGEIEHKTIYKSRYYDIDEDGKRNITEHVFDVLKASDQQLLTLFTNGYSEKRIIEVLFFKQTCKEISSIKGTDILAIHYQNFFRIFNNDLSDASLIKNYVAKKLLNEETTRSTVVISDSEPITGISELIKSRYLPFDISFVYTISQLLHEYENQDQFIRYLAQTIYTVHSDDEEYEPTFSEDEEERSKGEMVFVMQSYIDELFRVKR